MTEAGSVALIAGAGLCPVEGTARDARLLCFWEGAHGGNPISPVLVVTAEASVRETKYGRVYDGGGWFVINARESRWRDAG